MQIPPDSRAWIDVSASALRRNYRRVADALGPDPWLVPMVKADGYGLGAHEVVRRLQPEAPAAWGVATVGEGAELRDGGVTGPIVVFSPIPPREWEAAVEYDLAVAASDEATLEGMARAARRRGRPARIHVEIDTGMGRAGFPAHAAADWAPRVSARLAADEFRWEGLFTHLHSADEAGGPGVEDQRATFVRVAALLKPGPDVRLHTANSAGAFRLGAEAGGARPGIFLYGGGVGPDLPAPDPVATVRARVVRVVDVPAGTTLGYGATYAASGPERWATLAIGYGDGLPRCLGNRGHALVAGRRVPLVGRISMDVTVANISGIPGVEPGNVATLVGRDGAEEIALDEVAALAGTISYEVLTGLTARLPRIWTEAV